MGGLFLSKLSADACKVLATYCTYKKLYDMEKDVYDVVAEFIRYIIRHQDSRSYTSFELGDLIEREFGINIPKLVLHSAIKRIKIIKIQNQHYVVCDEELDRNEHFDKIQDEFTNRTSYIFQQFDQFIKVKYSDYLDKGLDRIHQALFQYLVDEEIGDNEESIISKFIVTYKYHTEFINCLNMMRAGHILYIGLQNNNHLSEFGSWKKTLVIFLDMEILFHLAGYNGEVYRQLAWEFMDLVKNVNSRKRYISLKYFSETKQDIEKFFDAAMYNDCVINPTATAMISILKDCHSCSDVLDKKSDFFGKLKQYRILEDDHKNYYSKDVEQYNLESQDILERYSKTNEEIIQNELRLKLISHINVLRRNTLITDYKDCQFILMTETKKTLLMAKDLVHEAGNNLLGKAIPCAVSLFALTNAIWYRLNGALKTTTKFPLTANSMIKAEIVLSALINKNIEELYEKTEDEFKSGIITKDQYINRIINYRHMENLPEKITPETDYSFITESAINARAEEYALLKNKNSEAQQHINDLNNKINEKDIALQKKSLECDLAKNKNLLYKIQKELEELENQRDNIICFKKFVLRIKYILIFLILIVTILLGAFILENISNFNIIEEYITIVGRLFTIIGILLAIANISISKKNIVNIISNFIWKKILKHDIPEIAMLIEIDKKIKNAKSKINGIKDENDKMETKNRE